MNMGNGEPTRASAAPIGGVTGIPAVVLAGGSATPEFRSATGVAKRTLMEFRGRTLLQIVVDALRQSGAVTDVVVVGDVPTMDAVRHMPDSGDFVANLLAGLDRCLDSPYAVVTTSDMPFVRADVVASFVRAAAELGADLVYPIVPVHLCTAAHPGLRRTSLPLREGRFTGGNMALARPMALLRQRERIQSAYAARKSPIRLAAMLGAGVTLRVALSLALRRGLIGLEPLESAASRLMGSSARALIVNEPALATDIDRPEDVAYLRSMPG